MDLQEKYDELENIISSLDLLIDELYSKEYIEELQFIKYKAIDEKEELEPELIKMQEKEENEINLQYERGRI